MEEKRDLFDLTFNFILFFLVTGVVMAIIISFIFNLLSNLFISDLQISLGWPVTYTRYFIETLIIALLTIRISSDFYFKTIKVDSELKEGLLKNIKYFLIIIAFLPNLLGIFYSPIQTIIYIILNAIIIVIIYQYFYQKITTI